MVGRPLDGPQVVAIGGGHGLAATIRAVRRYAGRTTAVVATADDGGSTGRLRSGMDIPAPGDLRRCLVAMAGIEQQPLGRALEYRFKGTDVEGHATSPGMSRCCAPTESSPTWCWRTPARTSR